HHDVVLYHLAQSVVVVEQVIARLGVHLREGGVSRGKNSIGPGSLRIVTSSVISRARENAVNVPSAWMVLIRFAIWILSFLSPTGQFGFRPVRFTTKHAGRLVRRRAAAQLLRLVCVELAGPLV